jgi:hypothetical protein
VRLTGFSSAGDSWIAYCYAELREFFALRAHRIERIESSNRETEQKERENGVANQLN